MNGLLDFPYPYSRDLKLTFKLTDEQLQDVCETIRSRMEQLLAGQEDPLVSVIFPAFNEEMYLLLMLWTLSQLATATPIQIIGVNNASSDRTGGIIEQCGITRIDENKKGTSYARQAGLEAAKGKYIGTTDADTQVPRRWIDANLAYFRNNPNLVCFSGESSILHYHPSRKIISHLLRTPVRIARTILHRTRKEEIRLKKEHINNFSGHNMFFRKEDAIAIGGYELGFNYGEDSLLAHKLSQRGEIFSKNDDMDAHVITSSRRVERWQGVVEMYYRYAMWGLWLDPRQYVPDKPMDFTDIR